MLFRSRSAVRASSRYPSATRSSQCSDQYAELGGWSNQSNRPPAGTFVARPTGPSKQTARVQLVIDGVIFQQQAFGGIRRLHTEVLTRLPSDIELRLVTEGRIEGDLPPGLPRRRIPAMVDVLRPGRLWAPVVPRATRAVRRLAFGTGEGSVFQSTYYTRAPDWAGAEVVWVYDMIHERYADRYTRQRDDELRARKREAVAHADAVIAISRATADDVQAVYGVDLADRLHVVPLAPVVLSTPPATTREPYLLHVGGRAGYKRFDTLLEAYAAWPGRHDLRRARGERARKHHAFRALPDPGGSRRDRPQPGCHPPDQHRDLHERRHLPWPVRADRRPCGVHRARR